MKALRTFLVDDEPVALRRLSQALRGIPDVLLVGTAGDGVSAQRAIVDAQPDLVILDIQMPGCSGLDLAAALARDPGPQVVFLTAFGEYAATAFEVDATDYLLKPVTVERLNQAVRRARRRLRAKRAESELNARPGAPEAPADGRPNEIWVPRKSGEARIKAGEIVWIEGAGDYVVIHTHLRSHLLRATMNSVEALFSPSRIRRVHRSSMVNMAIVDGIQRAGRGAITLLIPDGGEVAVGPNYSASVLAALKGPQ